MVDLFGQQNPQRTFQTFELQALSIASPTARLLTTSASWKAIQLFDRSINLAAENGAFISVTEAGIEPGPFSISVRDTAGGQRSFRQMLLNGDNEKPAVIANPQELQIGRLRIDLKGAQEWDPLLPKGRLVDWTASSAIARIVELIKLCAPRESLPVELGRDEESPVGSRILKSWRQIRQALAGRIPDLCFEGAQSAAGAGVGLTPAGDDFLSGVLLAMWLSMTEPKPYIDALVAGAIGRTGQLSMAFLQAAARGEASHTWHRLVDAIVLSDTDLVDKAVFALLGIGHTSGADALFGFVLALGTLGRSPDNGLEDSNVDDLGGMP